jgi:hypothetical protein
MEADWEVEIGGQAPVIEAQWPGFVDLRLAPEQAWSLAEAAELPALASALAKLNSMDAPVWTSKCDFWPEVELSEIDADELNAPSESVGHATGCYIDLLAKGDQPWTAPEMAVAECERWCGVLRAVPLRCCRMDLIVRRAWMAPERTDLGITAYLTACGATAAEARQTLERALAAFADALCGHSRIQ